MPTLRIKWASYISWDTVKENEVIALGHNRCKERIVFARNLVSRGREKYMY